MKSHLYEQSNKIIYGQDDFSVQSSLILNEFGR